MSYSICRIQKIKSSGVTGIQLHDRRDKGVSHTNCDIDWNRTNENISLFDTNQNFKQVIKNRIKDLNLPRAVRKDATVMTQCLITSDSIFFNKLTKKEQLKFFEHSFDFVKDTYGEENMIAATIHFDETTPHLHINFLPVTKDGRLSARDLFSPKKLRQLQDNFNKYITAKGYDLERGKTDSKRKHLSVEEFKIESRLEVLKERKKLNESFYELEKVKLDNKLNSLKDDFNALKIDFNKHTSTKCHIDDINDLKCSYGLLNKKNVTIADEDFKYLKKLSKKAYILELENEGLKEKVTQYSARIDNLYNSNSNFSKKVYSLEQKLTRSRTMVKEFVQYLEKNNLDESFKSYLEELSLKKKELNKAKRFKKTRDIY